MGQQSLIYAFVARGTVVIADYTEFTGNFTAIASQCLQKLPATNNKFTYNCDGHTFNYLVDNGYSNLLSSLSFVFFLFPLVVSLICLVTAYLIQRQSCFCVCSRCC
ncbi:Detected protein of confused Function [Hibiscus syriacus]|uniref:Detected protein of confused Function n=1 Tax=Hibiscus syriacus TaxID=106335 RepID=A0A6A3C1R4_HIBSY|nr:Detected protein of confused Function [Hibiscus syriacus]